MKEVLLLLALYVFWVGMLSRPIHRAIGHWRFRRALQRWRNRWVLMDHRRKSLWHFGYRGLQYALLSEEVDREGRPVSYTNLMTELKCLTDYRATCPDFSHWDDPHLDAEFEDILTAQWKLREWEEEYDLGEVEWEIEKVFAEGEDLCGRLFSGSAFPPVRNGV